jgi:beta-phosphoglucomutase-like phosphatase (HAD superfamily)
VKPGDCVVIEDSPAGARAALEAGMHAIGFAPGDTAQAMRARGVEVMAAMNELPRHIAALR